MALHYLTRTRTRTRTSTRTETANNEPGRMDRNMTKHKPQQLHAVVRRPEFRLTSNHHFVTPPGASPTTLCLLHRHAQCESGPSAKLARTASLAHEFESAGICVHRRCAVYKNRGQHLKFNEERLKYNLKVICIADALGFSSDPEILFCSWICWFKVTVYILVSLTVKACPFFFKVSLG